MLEYQINGLIWYSISILGIPIDQRVRFPNDQPTPVPIRPNLQAVVMAWIIRCPCPSSRLGEDIEPLESQHLKIN